MIPAKLDAGDEIRIVSPAVSLGFIPREQRQLAEERWRGLGLRISYSPNAEVLDRFDSSPVEARVSDLHGAFADPGFRGMLTTLGGRLIAPAAPLRGPGRARRGASPRR